LSFSLLCIWAFRSAALSFALRVAWKITYQQFMHILCELVLPRCRLEKKFVTFLSLMKVLTVAAAIAAAARCGVVMTRNGKIFGFMNQSAVNGSCRFVCGTFCVPSQLGELAFVQSKKRRPRLRSLPCRPVRLGIFRVKG